jgi:enoyl-CoA hydratase
MKYEILKPSRIDSIDVLTISRPNAMNALNTQFFNEMNDYLENLEKDSDSKCLLITGDGTAFVAGADIKEMQNKSSAQAREFSQYGQQTFSRIENLSIPVIAAINGFALGGGCELSLACDIRIASKNAKMGQPEVNLGLIPGYGATQRLARLIGLSNALYLLYTADMVNAEEALRMGLVQKISEPEELMNDALNLAKKIISKGPLAIKKIKSVTRTGLNLPVEEGYVLEAETFGFLFDTKQTKEGINAFIEKRKPNWPD